MERNTHMLGKISAAASIAALMIAFGATPLAAQTSDEYAPQSEPAAPASSSADMVGKAVFDSTGQQVGTVEEITTVEDGSEAAVLSVGGFLGLGEKKIAVVTSDLQPSSDGSGFTLAMTADEIEAAPAYGESAEPAPEEEPEQ